MPLLSFQLTKFLLVQRYIVNCPDLPLLLFDYSDYPSTPKDIALTLFSK